ncbi:hypothetical protein OA530_04400, partial [Pelagibacteraceae bacterium]|nr:hypothetical protein [Pelagibacteraceae bacterium]
LAWSPLLSGRISKKISHSKLINTISQKNNISEKQLILAWLNSKKNIFPICRSSNKIHILENFKATQISLDLNDLNLINESFENIVTYIPPNEIIPVDGFDRKVYKTLEEAFQNKSKMSPSPQKLSEDFLNGLQPKPIKVKKENEKYILIEGRLKYWAWIIAFGDKRPIPSIVE